MNKKSHLFVTGKIADRVPEKCRLWFLIGSIMPDILFYTYIKGHTWESSYNNICKKMCVLEKNGRENRHSYLALGYVLHYVEDFYTLAHNPVFDGGLSRHIAYEKNLAGYLQEENVTLYNRNNNAMSLNAVMEYLKKSHEEYLKEAGNYETDIRHIYEAVETVGNCLMNAIEANSREEQYFVLHRRQQIWGKY